MDDASLNATVGKAIDALIAERRKDTAFMERLDRYVIEERELLDRLAGSTLRPRTATMARRTSSTPTAISVIDQP